jgi:hypothetical protein
VVSDPSRGGVWVSRRPTRAGASRLCRREGWRNSDDLGGWVVWVWGFFHQGQGASRKQTAEPSANGARPAARVGLETEKQTANLGRTRPWAALGLAQPKFLASPFAKIFREAPWTLAHCESTLCRPDLCAISTSSEREQMENIRMKGLSNSHGIASCRT